MVAFLLIAGTRVHRFMDAPNKVETTLEVQALDEYEGHADLRNVELYPGYVKVEFNGEAGDPTTWVEDWHRLSDVKFEQSNRSLVRWTGNKVVVEHQQPLTTHGPMALRFEVVGRNAINLVIAPAFWAIVIGGLIFLWLLLRNTPERVKTDETGRFVRPRGPRVDLNE